MALSRSETIEKADICTNKAIEFQQEISKVLSELADFQGEVSQVSLNVSKSIKAEDITVGCSKSLSNVNKKISECSIKICEYIQCLAKDCNTFIEKLETDYNNDLAERKRMAKDNKEPEITESDLKLKRIEINADGYFSVVGSKGTGSSNGTGSSGTGANGYSQSFIDKYKVQLDYVLNQNLIVGIDSSKINNWDAFIMDFIKINNFDSKVKGISLSGGIVKCELLNGQKYDFQNIKSYSDLVDAIRKVI